MSIRVRFAPSPTGYLHVGGARTALFNWLYARQHGGVFVLRIEDTDEARNTSEALDAIYDGLRWLGIDWDEGPDIGGPHGPYRQSERLSIYDRYLKQLQDTGDVYTEDGGAVRFRFSRQPITIPDLVCGDVTFAATEEPDMTLRRPDGSYIFHFVNVVDDIEMKITHVFRGEDHLSNTWKHLDLFRALGAVAPTYAHIPLLLNPTGSKMSKRDEGASVGGYAADGFLPEAVFNYLCLLGWTPRTEQEKLDREQLIDLFDTDHIHKSNARFDLAKCKWFNAQYLRELTPEALLQASLPFLTEAGLAVNDEATAAKILQSVKEKVHCLTEFPAWVHFFFKDNPPFEEEALAKLQAKKENRTMLGAASEALASQVEWTEDSIQSAIQDAATRVGVKAGALMPLLRAALSGQMRGPGIPLMAQLLGKEVSLHRIAEAQNRIAAE